MANVSTQLNSLIGDGKAALLNAKKGKTTTVDDALLGAGISVIGFQTLLSKLSAATAGTGLSVGKVLASAHVAVASDKKAASDLLSGIEFTPELLAALKALTPDQLTAIAQNPTGTDLSLLKVLDALSKTDLGLTTDTSSLFQFVNDPVLAQTLGDVASQIKTLQVTGTLPATPFADALQTALRAFNAGDFGIGDEKTSTTTTDTTTAKVSVDAKTGNHTVTLQVTPQQTITLADLNNDEFEAFKKLAFADLAPFLTQPRLVRIDNNTVMKVAQGPAFLNDEGTEATALKLLSGLMPVLVKALKATQANTNTGTATQTNAAATTTSTPTSLVVDASTTATVPTAPLVVAQTNTATTPTISTATPQLMITITASTAEARGFADVATGLDNGLDGASALDIASAFSDFLSVSADQNSPQAGASTLLTAKTAASAHPSSHLVSAVLQKAGFDAKAPSEKQIVIQLDPPSLGRLKITLDFAENNVVKAKLIAERPETASLLQKDSALLEKALQGSGFDTSAPGAITFDVAQDNAFSQQHSNQHSQQGQGNQGSDEDGTDLAISETMMAIFVDPETGLTHVNIVI